MKNPLRFRQVHLDFHTSPDISGIGSRFDKSHWQRTLQSAAVDSITCFSKCHHGWSYHPTKVGKTHPHLGFDLLRAQYEACKEIGINVPIYLSVGIDDVAAHEHPEWREMDVHGGYAGGCIKPLEPGFRTLDFHSPYLDYLCAQIEEVARLYPDGDGIFLDIVCQWGAGSRWSFDYMYAHDLDPAREEDRQACLKAALDRYYQRTTAAAKSVRPDMPVFHNSGHVMRGDYDTLRYQDHLELESLPTGGWGYDHFPESAQYVTNLDRSFLGMTGKFHTSWGEFGGYKHPNALRYECASMLANGSRCSIGDQLHPTGALDESTYAIIGEAYREVAAKEPWCLNTEAVSDIAILSSQTENPAKGTNNHPDTGACRILLEGHHLFTLIDRTMDFRSHKMLILPDDIEVDDFLEDKIGGYLQGGGKLLLTGRSGFRKSDGRPAFDLGADHSGSSPYEPDYILPAPAYRAAFVQSPLVMYARSERIRVTTGESLGQVYDPYFNRTFRHYCSHRQTPNQPDPSGFDSGVRQGNLVYLAHPLFTIYRAFGAVAYKEHLLRVIDALLDEDRTITTALPSTARLTLQHQPEQGRHVLHLLYANKLARGGAITLDGVSSPLGQSLEVIEELDPLPAAKLSLRLPKKIGRVTLEPQGANLPFLDQDGKIEIQLGPFTCHQMIVFQQS